MAQRQADSDESVDGCYCPEGQAHQSEELYLARFRVINCNEGHRQRFRR